MKHLADRPAKRVQRVDRHPIMDIRVFAASVILVGCCLSVRPAFAAEPAFPGKGATDEQFQVYWASFGKDVLENAPYHVKNGTAIDKAKYLFPKVGDKLAAHGITPNNSFLFGTGGGRVGGVFADGRCDLGSCTDTSSWLQDAFYGAGIQSDKVAMDKGSVQGNIDLTDVNRNHVGLRVVGENGVQMFDLWLHGVDKGTYAGAGSSHWNGMGGKEYLDRMKGKGYERFEDEATGGAPMGPAKDMEDKFRRLQEERERDDKLRQRVLREKAEEKAEKERKRKEEERKRKEAEEAQRKAALDAAIKQANELIAAARAAAGRAQTAIAAAKSAAAAGSNASSAAGAEEAAAQQAKGAADAARSACARVVSEGVIDAARARAEGAAGDVGALYQEVTDLAEEACQAAAQAEKASNVAARRIFTTKAEALVARAESRAASAQAALGRAQAEAGQAARQNADRQVARQQGEAAKAALATARGQLSASEGAMNGYEASVTGAQGQMAAAQTEIGQMEQNKKAAHGVLSPFLSDPQAQMLVPVINGVVAPTVEGLDQQLQSSLTTIQQARGRIQAAVQQLSAWEGSFAACDGLAPTDGLAQAATSAASTAELFVPKISAAAGRAAQCAGASPPGTDPGVAGGKPDTAGASEAGSTFQGGSPWGTPPGPTSGATGGGQPIEQPGLKPPPTTGAGEAGTTPGQQPPQQGIWCYSEKTKDYYMIPYGPCPPPWMKPPTGATATGEPGRIPWQGLVPPEGKPLMGPKPPMGSKPPMGPKPSCGPATSCTCAGGGIGHIPCDKSKGACHCGGG